MSLALGIDIGTSGARAIAMARDGSIAAMASAAMPAPDHVEGRIQQDPQIWLTAISSCIFDISKQIEIQNIEAVSIDGTSGTIVAINGKGRPLAPALMYNDPSAKAESARLSALAPPETAALGATSPLARALLLQRMEGVSRIVHQADWVAGHLSGDFAASDENNALKTGYDPVARRWPDWIATAGLRMDLLPRVYPAGARTGTVTQEACKAYGFRPGVAVVAGTTDGCAAFLANGTLEPGDGVTSLGTTLTIKLLSAAPVFAPQFGIYSHRIGGTWLAGGASNTGGAALLKHFSREEMAALQSRLDPQNATGLDYYPLPQPGERFPVNDPNYPPRLDPRPADDAVFFQGLLEGIAAIEALGYRRLAELGATPLKTMRTVGGGAANAPWTAIRQRTLGVPFLGSASREAAAGTARLAWRGVGVNV
jgi:D-ribulokinase